MVGKTIIPIRFVATSHSMAAIVIWSRFDIIKVLHHRYLRLIEEWLITFFVNFQQSCETTVFTMLQKILSHFFFLSLSFSFSIFSHILLYFFFTKLPISPILLFHSKIHKWIHCNYTAGILCPELTYLCRRSIHAVGFGQLRMHIYCYNNSRTVNHGGKRAL